MVNIQEHESSQIKYILILDPQTTNYVIVFNAGVSFMLKPKRRQLYVRQQHHLYQSKAHGAIRSGRTSDTVARFL